MIKSHTDIEQSKKLAEILPTESADMHYCLENRDVATGYEIGITSFIQAKKFKGKCNIIDVKPAWSLAALLGVIKSAADYTMQSVNCKESFIVCELGDKPWNITTQHDNEIDACVEMIEKLHERKML